MALAECFIIFSGIARIGQILIIFILLWVITLNALKSKFGGLNAKINFLHYFLNNTNILISIK